MSRVPPKTLDRRIADVLPRESGELVFYEDWEKRVFGMAVALCEQELFPFDDFRWRVTSEIGRWEHEYINRGREETFDFHHCWLVAFERLLLDRGILSKEDIDKRVTEYLEGVQRKGGS